MDNITRHLPDIELPDIELPDIEGEWQEDSGFGCRACGNLLNVGSISCPQCHQTFTVATPSLKALNAAKHPLKMQAMALIYKDRMTASEIRAIHLAQKPFWTPIRISSQPGFIWDKPDSA